MSEIRLSFRPAEIRLLVLCLEAVRARAKWQLGANGYASGDGRDWCINSFALDEIEVLKARLESHVSDDGSNAASKA